MEPNSVFVFSSSDNTDPRTNGRSYWAVNSEAAVSPKKEIPKPNGKIVVRLRRPFETFKGSHMAIAHGLDALAEFADDTLNENQSPIELYENDRQLGPAHSSHRDIARTGDGRYSHWKTQGMVFSTSDNSDPNRNRQRYWAVLPETQSNEPTAHTQ
jgi:hypothetical protein